jgi:translocation and assembly module TamA
LPAGNRLGELIAYSHHVLKKKSVRASLVSRIGNLGFFLGGLASVGTSAEARQTVPKAATSSDRSIESVVAPPAGATLPVVETIINDEEFEKAVPPLPPGADPAHEMPLESIDEFERRLIAGTHNTVLRSSDPELARPLPPLGQFDVREVELAAPAANPASTETRYTVTVEGLDKPDAETEASLQGQFNSLSALRESKGKATNEAMLAARLTEDSTLLQRILQAEGWYDAKVDTRIDHGAAAPTEPAKAVLSVVAGYSLATVTVTADPTVPPALIADSLALKPGQPIVADRIQGAEANVAIVLPQNGYAFAEVGQRDVLLDPETHLGDYTLPVTVGPRGRFGAVKTAGKLAFDAHHVSILGRFKPGDLYDSRQVDDLRKALVATGLFSTVTVVPERTAQKNADGTEPVTLLVTQDAGKPRTLAATAGYGTGEGFRIAGSWTHANYFRPEGAVSAAAVLGTAEQSASLTFRRSNAGKRDRTFQVTLQALHSNYKAFEALTGQLSARLSYDSTPLWQKPLTYAVGAEILGTVEESYDVGAAARTKRRYLIGGLSGLVGIDRTDSLLNPTKGFRASILLQPEGSLSGRFTPYVRGQLDASAYRPFGDAFVLAARARIGSSANIDRDTLAPSRRFYAGGGGSVRGFSYQGLGPRDPDNRPLGGLSVVEGAAEARYRFGDYGIVGFVDVGQVYNKRVPDFSNLRAGVGIGGRFYTDFGPFRLDVATPIGRKKGESRFNLYVSIGQAF